MNLSERIKYKVDLKETLFENLVHIAEYCILFMFMIFGFNNIKIFENEINQLMYFIVLMFSIIQLVKWIKHPVVVFKRKENE